MERRVEYQTFSLKGSVLVKLQNIRVVMIETTHPGNIGAAARAMKTMGLSQLVLVRPQGYPCVEATARSAGADDILAAARVVEDLESALEGCRFVMGTSARLRSLALPVLDPREASAQVGAETLQGDVALVFGTERTGLTNEEMARCHKLVNIPTNPDYSSLNVASAVQVLSYEMRMQSLQGVASDSVVETADHRQQPATADQMESFFGHLDQVMAETGFSNPENPGRLMPRLRRLYNRARPTLEEVNILRGIFTAAQKAYRK